jgi:senataxin
MSNDSQRIAGTTTELLKLLSGSDITVAAPAIQETLWKRVYEILPTTDCDAISTVIIVVGSSAHMDLLNKKAFLVAAQRVKPSEGIRKVDPVLDKLNACLGIFHNGFFDAVSKYANFTASSSLVNLFRRDGVVKALMMLMLSPVENIQIAAQTLVGQTFDVDARADCFRALLQNMPQVALAGISEFLQTFVKYAPSAIEACSLSKSLVRCLTDIIEVLCSAHDGLLNDKVFTNHHGDSNPSAALPEFWTLMTKAITIIFKRTPSWAKYFDNEEMIVWMRDALIFCRDLLAQRRVIEASAMSRFHASPTVGDKEMRSNIAKKMIYDLQDFLPELARWLRLTDEELLHQSFSLLQSLLDCFRESDIPPSAPGLAKLNRHIEDARKNDPNSPQTRLDSARLA